MRARQPAADGGRSARHGTAGVARAALGIGGEHFALAIFLRLTPPSASCRSGGLRAGMRRPAEIRSPGPWLWPGARPSPSWATPSSRDERQAGQLLLQVEQQG